MFDPVTFGGGFVSGGAMGAVLAHFFTRDREREGRLRQFRDAFNEIASGLAAHRNTGLGKAYQDTRPIIRSECAKILEDIRRWRRGGFQSAADSYLGLTPQQTDPSADPKHMTDAFTVQQRQDRFDTARALMVKHLRGIVKHAR